MPEDPRFEYQSNITSQVWDAYRAGEMDRLDVRACIDRYAQPFVSSNRHVVLVSVSNSSTTTPGPRIFDSAGGGDVHITGAMDGDNLDSHPWICGNWTARNDGSFCDIDSLGYQEESFQWTIENRTVEYCLSEAVEEHCKLRLSVGIAILVSVLNLLKSILVMFVAFSIKEDLLLNMGDAVASFLRRPDHATQGSCLLAQDEIEKQKTGYVVPQGTRVFHDQRKRWFSAVTRRRLLVVSVASFVGLLICVIFLVYGLFSMPGASASDIWRLGFAEATEHTLITFAGIRRRMIRASGTLSNVLIANAGQTVLSLLYFCCNGLLTAMCLAHEWSSYAVARKGLRVSSKTLGKQRSTYFLSLPARYAVPMILAGIVLHWLASQSIFLITVEQWTNDFDTYEWVHDDFHDFATCAWSPMALCIFVIVAAILMCVLLALGFRRFKSAMPVAGSCSLAMAAACYAAQEYEPELVERLPLQVLSKIREGADILVHLPNALLGIGVEELDNVGLRGGGGG